MWFTEPSLRAHIATNKLVKSKHSDCNVVKGPASVSSRHNSEPFSHPPFYLSRLEESFSIRCREEKSK